MGILSWLAVGLVAGFLARLAVPGSGTGGVVSDIVIGIFGAFIGGWTFSLFGHSGVDGLNAGSIGVAFVGAVILLFVLRAFGRKGTAA